MRASRRTTIKERQPDLTILVARPDLNHGSLLLRLAFIQPHSRHVCRGRDVVPRLPLGPSGQLGGELGEQQVQLRSEGVAAAHLGYRSRRLDKMKNGRAGRPAKRSRSGFGVNRFAETPVRSLSNMSNSGTVRHSGTHSMPWPHPFITVDQNQLRHPDRIARLLDDCCRSGLHVLLPDGAFLEFAKSGHFADTTRQSLRLLAPYRELVAAGCKLSHLMSSELQGRVPAVQLRHDGATEFLRSILDDLNLR
jgi:hypothetical protein